MQPSVGRIVHYVSYGTPGGEFIPECRAAIITEVPGGAEDQQAVGLCVLNPTGQYFNPSVPFSSGAERPGAPDCEAASVHGHPFRYCACGWAEASPQGGTWHWPERTP